MKKTYIIPQVLIVRVAAQRMISTSTLGLDNSTENALNSEEILTKRNGYSVWSDDWSE